MNKYTASTDAYFFLIPHRTKPILHSSLFFLYGTVTNLEVVKDFSLEFEIVDKMLLNIEEKGGRGVEAIETVHRRFIGLKTLL